MNFLLEIFPHGVSPLICPSIIVFIMFPLKLGTHGEHKKKIIFLKWSLVNLLVLLTVDKGLNWGLATTSRTFSS